MAFINLYTILALFTHIVIQSPKINVVADDTFSIISDTVLERQTEYEFDNAEAIGIDNDSSETVYLQCKFRQYLSIVTEEMDKRSQSKSQNTNKTGANLHLDTIYVDIFHKDNVRFHRVVCDVSQFQKLSQENQILLLNLNNMSSFVNRYQGTMPWLSFTGLVENNDVNYHFVFNITGPLLREEYELARNNEGVLKIKSKLEVFTFKDFVLTTMNYTNNDETYNDVIMDKTMSQQENQTVETSSFRKANTRSSINGSSVNFGPFVNFSNVANDTEPHRQYNLHVLEIANETDTSTSMEYDAEEIRMTNVNSSTGSINGSYDNEYVSTKTNLTGAPKSDRRIQTVLEQIHAPNVKLLGRLADTWLTSIVDYLNEKYAKPRILAGNEPFIKIHKMNLLEELCRYLIPNTVYYIPKFQVTDKIDKNDTNTYGSYDFQQITIDNLTKSVKCNGIDYSLKINKRRCDENDDFAKHNITFIYEYSRFETEFKSLLNWRIVKRGKSYNEYDSSYYGGYQTKYHPNTEHQYVEYINFIIIELSIRTKENGQLTDDSIDVSVKFDTSPSISKNVTQKSYVELLLPRVYDYLIEIIKSRLKF